MCLQTFDFNVEFNDFELNNWYYILQNISHNTIIKMYSLRVAAL